MNISINGKAADITLENEKNVGDILSGLEQWLTGTGNRLSGLVVDGSLIGAEALDECFGLEVSQINNIDILVSSWPELAAEALAELGKTCTLYQEAAFEERGETAARWEASPAASFLSLEIPDLALLAENTFAGEGFAPSDLGILTEERLREMENPRAEILAMQELVSGICARMEELPLDIQLGKDFRAAETMQIFTRTSEKLFRLMGILKHSGFSMEDFTVEGLPVKAFNNEFSTALKELCSAYESRDTVLAGDLTEYELAPRLLKLYGALKENFSVSIF
jgi:hypothetical protein